MQQTERSERSPTVETTVKPDGRARTQFKPGNRAAAKGPPPTRQESDFDRLKAMRHVLTNPKSTDISEGEKACRVWLDKSPGPFMEAYDRLEAESRKQQTMAAGGEVEDEPLEETESDEQLKESITALLKRHQQRAKT